MKILLLFLFVSLEYQYLLNGQSSLKVNHIALKVNHIVIVNETGVYHPLDLYLLCLHTEREKIRPFIRLSPNIYQSKTTNINYRIR